MIKKLVLFLSILILTGAGCINKSFAAEKISSTSSEAKILFAGDMMFDRYIRQTSNKRGADYLFSCVDPLLKTVDFVVANLEGPITANSSISVNSVMGSPENYKFTFPTTTAKLLLAHNIKIVNIGNNHINNYNASGIASTQKYLINAGVAYFGGLVGNNPFYQTTTAGINLSFVNYNQFGGEPAEKIAKIIAAQHSLNRKVIVYTHWGEEYVEPTKNVRQTAALFAKNGADLIIGSHPHIIQTHETIGNTQVYYSLGNFIFDQYWDKKTTKGLMLLVRISNNKISIEEKFVNLKNDGQSCLTLN